MFVRTFTYTRTYIGGDLRSRGPIWSVCTLHPRRQVLSANKSNDRKKIYIITHCVNKTFKMCNPHALSSVKHLRTHTRARARTPQQLVWPIGWPGASCAQNSNRAHWHLRSNWSHICGTTRHILTQSRQCMHMLVIFVCRYLQTH